MRADEIITDEEIERVHANANFGPMDKRTVVNQGVLKCASGYYRVIVKSGGWQSGRIPV